MSERKKPVSLHLSEAGADVLADREGEVHDFLEGTPYIARVT